MQVINVSSLEFFCKKSNGTENTYTYRNRNCDCLVKLHLSTVENVLSLCLDCKT